MADGAETTKVRGAIDAPPMDRPVFARRVVVVEDDPECALLVEMMIREALGSDVQVSCVSSIEDALDAVEDAACVLLDLGLPDADGLDGLARIAAVAPHVPVVVLSGREDEQLAVRAVQEGAQDFVTKRRVDAELLGRAIRYAIERKSAEVELAYLALYDPLTSLANRRLLVDRLTVALARSLREAEMVAVLFCDLNGFKLVNDSLGHEAGDELLVEVADRLRGLVRPSDTVARFGGDEFVVACDGIEGVQAAKLLADRVVDGLAQRFEVNGTELFVRAAIGVAIAHDTAISPEELIRDADQAMYAAKRSGRGIQVFSAAPAHRSLYP